MSKKNEFRAVDARNMVEENYYSAPSNYTNLLEYIMDQIRARAFLTHDCLFVDYTLDQKEVYYLRSLGYQVDLLEDGAWEISWG